MDLQFDRHFTVSEANAMIPHVQRLFREVHVLLQFDPSIDPAVDSRIHISGNPNGNFYPSGNGHTNGNGNGHGITEKPTDYSEWSQEKRREAAYRLINALQEQGIVIQDLERGLIDFPSIHKGTEVFLCYELKDGDVIEYFHDLHSGFAGRQKISE